MSETWERRISVEEVRPGLRMRGPYGWQRVTATRVVGHGAGVRVEASRWSRAAQARVAVAETYPADAVVEVESQVIV